MKDINLGLTADQRACVELLEEALSVAREGDIDTVGIIACMKGGFASTIAGRRAPELNLACDSLKRKILDAIEEQGASKRKSNIVGA